MPKIEPADVVGMRMNLGGMRDAVDAMHCVSEPIGCGRVITQLDYLSWDPVTLKEYSQSGWCRECQDKVFKDPEDEDENLCSCDSPCCKVDVVEGYPPITCGSQHCRLHGAEFSFDNRAA